MAKREVPVLTFVGSAFTNPKSFANDLVDCIDAKIQGGAYEALMDMPKPILKQALADIMIEKFHTPMAQHTITCEE